MFRVRKTYSENCKVYKISDYVFTELGAAFDFYEKEKKRAQHDYINDNYCVYGPHHNTYQVFTEFKDGTFRDLIFTITVEEA